MKQDIGPLDFAVNRIRSMKTGESITKEELAEEMIAETVFPTPKDGGSELDKWGRAINGARAMLGRFSYAPNNPSEEILEQEGRKYTRK